MGERRAKSSLNSSRPHSAHARKMASPSPGMSNLTALLQSAPYAGNPTFVWCPPEIVTRLRNLNEAEIITLFTPFVPHPPTTDLAKNMDPFEPLGRSLPRQVRHVPYRLDHGMTELHADFLPTSGAVIIVICSTENVTSHNPHAFEQQLRFARDVAKKVDENKALSGVPLILLLSSNGAGRQSHEVGVKGFPALVTVDDYTPAALNNAVRVMFGK